MIEIKEIRASEWLDAARGLMMEHYHEVAEQTGMPPPSMDKGATADYEDAGVIYTVGAFDGDVLIGYSINLVAATFNFADQVIMQNEGLFVKKQYRDKLVGIKLIRESERIAKDRGATRAQWHTYKDSRADALFHRMGYNPFDVIYTREL